MKLIVVNHGRYRVIRVVVLITAALGAAVAGCSPQRMPPPTSQSSPAALFAHFHTLPPGSALPSGAQCARRVGVSPGPDIRLTNQAYNRTVGQHVGPTLFPRGDSPQSGLLSPRISGDFTGTTEQILQWAACKWGINQDVVFAQAAAESSWRQDHLGDWGTDGSRCPPGHGIGADGLPGQCPQSYGILQTKYRLWKEAWPGIATSTAMNADVAYAIWRSCFDGYEVWLNNTAPSTQPYRAGDLWGCVGRWYAGSWYTPAADQYINRIQSLLRERVWNKPAFTWAG
jgi:hypothetical protein